MISLLVHAALGVAVVVAVVRANPGILSTPPGGPRFSRLEVAYYAIGLVSVAIGWFFNVRFVDEYADGNANPLWGEGSWADYIRLMYTNPAAASASEDFTVINVLLLPLFTVIDGTRRGIRRPWLFFATSLFTSCSFAFAYYFATVERQRRHDLAISEAVRL